MLDKNRPYAQVLAEYVDGEEIASYLYGLDLISQERNDVDAYYLVDGLGSTRGLADSTGNVTDIYHYDAYGNLIDSVGSSENDYLFAGEQFDSNLDQYYLRQRYYDPSVGRFTRRDTWEGRNNEPITLHKYIYANANPVNYIDPSGLFSKAEQLVTIQLLTSLAAITAVANFQLNYTAHHSARLNSTILAGISAIYDLPGELRPAAQEALNEIIDAARDTLNNIQHELDQWQLIVQMPTGEERIAQEIYWPSEPPAGPFVILEYEGDAMRVLGLRIRHRYIRRMNELIGRVDYHPHPRHFPGYDHTLHYHIGPNANAHVHHFLWPERRTTLN